TEEDKVTAIQLDQPLRSFKLTSFGKSALYGMTFERQKGLVIDAQMLVGAHTNQLSHFNEAHIKDQVKRSAPDLMLYQCGENEAYFDPNDAKIQAFKRDYVLGIKRTRPDAKTPCLVISIKDIGEETKNAVRTRPGVPKIVSASRVVAAEAGCAYY